MDSYSLVVGWLDPGTTEGPFTHSLAQLCAYEAARGRLRAVIRIQSGPHLEEGRNRLVESFMRTDADWLLMVDADMVFEHCAVEDLLSFASPQRPVVGGLCAGISDKVGVYPTVFGRTPDGLPTVVPVEGFTVIDGVVEVAGTGAAFLAVHRSVFDSIDRGDGPRWFRRREVFDGNLLGEDLSFCWDVTDKGFPIVVVPSVNVGHVKKTVVYAESTDVSAPWLQDFNQGGSDPN
jgi:hypothetical protein